MDGRKKNRSDASLGSITLKFLQKLEESEDYTVDLNTVTDILGGSRRRRLYDITCVLEGIGLLKRKGKSKFEWKGNKKIIDPDDEFCIVLLKEEISALDEYEKILDSKINLIEKCINNLTEINENKKYLFISESELSKELKEIAGNTVIIKSDTKDLQLRVLSNDNIFDTITLKSKSGPIQVHYYDHHNTTGQQIKKHHSSLNVSSLDLEHDIDMDKLLNQVLENNENSSVIDIDAAPSTGDYNFIMASDETASDLF